VLAHIVVVDCLLDQPSAADERVDGPGRGVGHAEERLALDLAHDSPIDLDAWVRPDHLQVEHKPARLDCSDQIAQDVHDVLRIHASERPREDDEIERDRLELDLLARGDPVADTLGELSWKRLSCSLDCLGVRVEGEHACGISGDAGREAPVAAAELQHAPSGSSTRVTGFLFTRSACTP